MAPAHIIISPGPGNPDEAGISKSVIRHFAGKMPIFGVCLGHQCIGEVFGGIVEGAGEILHGKVSTITHDGKGVFAGIRRRSRRRATTRWRSGATACRTCWRSARRARAASSWASATGRCRRGVQFHPESIFDARRPRHPAELPGDEGVIY